MLKAVVLDCDGVVLESVDIKTRAFQDLFKSYPNELDRIVRLHLDNGSLPRQEKFKLIYRDCLRIPLTESERERLEKEFSRFVLKRILSCPFVPGAPRFLEEIGAQFPLYLASGTPETELQEIVERRKLTRYFRGVYGSPSRKDSILREILRLNALLACELLFIGDSKMDFDASVATGVHFIGRVSRGSASLFPPSIRWLVADLEELIGLWPAILSDLT